MNTVRHIALCLDLHHCIQSKCSLTLGDEKMSLKLKLLFKNEPIFVSFIRNSTTAEFGLNNVNYILQVWIVTILDDRITRKSFFDVV